MALKLCEPQYDNMMGYDRLHEVQNRATPMKMMKYRLAIQLYKIYNNKSESQDWLDLNFQQNFNDRYQHVYITDVSVLRIGKNCIMNRLDCINEKFNTIG